MRVHYGTDTDFSMMTHGIPNQTTATYLAQQFTNLNPAMFTDTTFIDNAYQIYEQYNGSAAVMRARNLIDCDMSWIDPNQIYYIDSLLGFQTASPLMQRFIMACPEVRQMYIEDRCHGYTETYVDQEPGMIGDDHYDYRLVTDGVLMDHPDDENQGIINVHLGYIPTFDRDLTEIEQLELYSMWDVLRQYMKGKDDPTDVFGGEL